MIRQGLCKALQPLLGSLSHQNLLGTECLQARSASTKRGHDVKMILVKDHPHLGPAGRMVTVRAGHARNELYPRGWAIYATSKNMKRAEQVIEQREQQQESKSDLERMLDIIAKGVLVVRRRLSWRSGEEKRMIGSVTAEHVQALASRQLGLELPRPLILMEQPITSPGAYKVPLGLLNRQGQQLELSVDVRSTQRM